MNGSNMLPDAVEAASGREGAGVSAAFDHFLRGFDELFRWAKAELESKEAALRAKDAEIAALKEREGSVSLALARLQDERESLRRELARYAQELAQIGGLQEKTLERAKRFLPEGVLRRIERECQGNRLRLHAEVAYELANIVPPIKAKDEDARYDEAQRRVDGFIRENPPFAPLRGSLLNRLYYHVRRRYGVERTRYAPGTAQTEILEFIKRFPFPVLELPDLSLELMLARSCLRLTQAEMADRLGVSLREYRSWEWASDQDRFPSEERSWRIIVAARALCGPPGGTPWWAKPGEPREPVSSPERLTLLRRTRGLRLGEAARRAGIPVWDLWSAERGDTVPLDARERLEAILRDGRYPLSGESRAAPGGGAGAAPPSREGGLASAAERALPERRAIPPRAWPVGWKAVSSPKRLAWLRRAAGLKLEEAAKHAGVSPLDLWNAERGSKVPPDVQERLEAVLRDGYPTRAGKRALARCSVRVIRLRGRPAGRGKGAPVSSPEKLLRRRLEAGLTRAQAAEQAGVSPTTLFKAESGGSLLPEFRARLERIIREGYRSPHGRPVDLFEELSAPVSSPEKLLRLRREAGLTLAEAAEQVGVSASSVRKAEHGGRLRPEIRAKFERILREGYRRKGEQIDLFGVAEA